MEKGKGAATVAVKDITTTMKKLNLKNSSVLNNPKKLKSRPSLVSLCLGIIGKHLEDIIPDLSDIAISFPAKIKVKSLLLSIYVSFYLILIPDY